MTLERSQVLVLPIQNIKAARHSTDANRAGMLLCQVFVCLSISVAPFGQSSEVLDTTPATTTSRRRHGGLGHVRIDECSFIRSTFLFNFAAPSKLSHRLHCFQASHARVVRIAQLTSKNNLQSDQKSDSADPIEICATCYACDD